MKLSMYLFVVGDILLVILSGISWVSFCRLQVFVSEIKDSFLSYTYSIFMDLKIYMKI